jgi:hypothetical protein
MTPPLLAARLVAGLGLTATSTVLEPSFGDGSFLVPVIDHLISKRSGSLRERYCAVMREQVYGVEIDSVLYRNAIERIERTFGPLPDEHHLVQGDFFRQERLLSGGFDLIVGNPPFGGTFDSDIEDDLDKRYGTYRSHKLKKETYSFFVAKAIEELAINGTLCFICSDTFLTIKTMRGLRELLLDTGEVAVRDLPDVFDGTSQPMVVLDFRLGSRSTLASICGRPLSRASMEATPNFSWGVSPDLVPLFDGPLLGEFIVATGGMTIGRNEMFVREIQPTGEIVEPCDFVFFDRPITVAGELERARLNRLSARRMRAVEEMAERGDSRRAVKAVLRAKPRRVKLPTPDYLPYNRSSSRRIYSDPTHAIYWRDDGDAVLTFKRDGPWYLHGVGGKPFFKREGLTWQLVAPRINARYLPAGYILDSGAPCAFLRDEIDRTELFVVLAWLQTALATKILKQVINHTRNIQGKDVERLPYPFWTSPQTRARAASLVEDAVATLTRGDQVDCALFETLDAMFKPQIEIDIAA